MRKEKSLVVRQTCLHRPGRMIIPLVLGGLSVLLSTGSITVSNPPLAVAVTFMVVLLLPGFLITRLLSWELGYIEEVVVSFTLSVGMWCIPAVLLLQLHSNLGVLTWIFVIVIIFLVSLYLYQSRAIARVPETDEMVSDIGDLLNPFLLGAFLLSISLALFLFLSTANITSGGDRWAYLGSVRQYLDTSRFHTEGMFLPKGSISTRHKFAGWTVMFALVSRISQVDPLDMYSFYLPPLLMVVSCFAFYSLAGELFKDRNQALFASLVQMLYYFSDMQSDEGMGIGFFARIVEDKYVAWLVVAPVATLLALRCLSGRRSYILGLSLAAAALGLTHPMGLTQFAMSFGSFALVHLLFDWDREKVTRFTIVFIPIVIFYIVPLIQRQRIEAYSFVVSALRLGGIHKDRVLPISDSLYIAHPHLIQHPMTILAILLTPLAIPCIKKNVVVQFLFSNMAIILFTIYNPLTAFLLGKLITPRMIWRVAWVLPVSLTIGFFAYKGVQKVQWPFVNFPVIGRLHLKRFMPVLVTILAAILLRGNIDGSIKNLNGWYYAKEISPAERAMLAYVRDQVPPGSTLMAEASVNNHLPAIVGHSYGIVFRQNLANPPLGYEDIRQFYNTEFIDESTLGILEKYEVEYVVLETGSPLAFQFSQLPMFYRIYYNDEFELFEVVSELQPNHVIIGNTYLAQEEWDKALSEYGEALTLNSEDTLAHLGLAQAYQAKGEMERALTEYEKVFAVNLDEVWLRFHLAEIYEAQGEREKAIAQYWQIIELEPDNADGYTYLSKAYKADGRIEEAIGVYEEAVAANPDQAWPHLGWGQLYWEEGRLEEALVEYQRVIELEPDNAYGYVYLSEAYKANGRMEEAIGVYEEAVAANPDRAWPRLRLGQLYQEEKRLKEAIAEYRKAIKLESGAAQAYTSLSEVYKADGRMEEAIGVYEEAVAANPDRAWPYLGLGQLYQEEGRLEEALAEYQRAIELEPDNAYGYVYLSGAYKADGRMEEAIGVYEEAVAANPDRAWPHLKLGQLYQEEKRLKEAIAEYWKAIKLESDAAQAYASLSRAYKADGRIEEAVGVYEEAVAANPDQTWPYLGLGQLYQEERRLEEAIAEYQRAIELEPDNADGYTYLSGAYKADGRMEEAIGVYEDAVAANPDRAWLHLGLGQLYQEEGRLEEAIAEYQRAIELEPDNAYGYTYLSGAYKADGRMEEAVGVYEDAVAANPDQAWPHLGLGQLYQEERRLEEAVAEYQRAIELEPDSAYVYLIGVYRADGRLMARLFLAEIYTDQGRIEDAIAICTEAIKLAPGSPSGYWRRARAYYSQGDYNHSLADWNKVIELGSPASSSAYFRRGEVYYELGDYERAMADWNKALELDPDYGLVYFYLGQLYYDQGDYKRAVADWRKVIELDPKLAGAYDVERRIEDALSQMLSN